MAKRTLPDLPATGRRYLENTQRARLASPGLERFEVKGRRTAVFFALAAVALAGLIAVLAWWLARG